MTTRQQRFLVGIAVVFSLILATITSDNLFVLRGAVWGLVIIVGLLSFSRENWIRPDKSIAESRLARFWLFASLLLLLGLAYLSLSGSIDLSGFVLDRPGILFLLVFSPILGAVIVSVFDRFKELGRNAEKRGQDSEE